MIKDWGLIRLVMGIMNRTDSGTFVTQNGKGIVTEFLPVDLSSGGGRRVRFSALEILEVLVSKGEGVGGSVAGNRRSRSCRRNQLSGVGGGGNIGSSGNRVGVASLAFHRLS